MSYITIYFDDKPVFLCDEITKEIAQYQHQPDTIFIDEDSTAAINSLLHDIKKAQFKVGILFNENLKKLQNGFFKHFNLIKAGGGLVKNKKDEILMIFRRGKWDLPKGKLDEGETIEECAVREVREETGLQHVEMGKFLEITYHTYVQFGKSILKESHWYAMKSTGAEELIPQTEEDITEIIWAKKTDLEKYKANTFPTIMSVLKFA